MIDVARRIASATVRFGVALVGGAWKIDWWREWLSRRFRRAVHRIQGPRFAIRTVHSLRAGAGNDDGTRPRLLDEAMALVDDHLNGSAPGDHEASCDGLPCGFLLLHRRAGGTSARVTVAGYVRVASAPGGADADALRRMARAGMAVQARQRAAAAGMPADAVEAVLGEGGTSPSPSPFAPSSSGDGTRYPRSGTAYLGSLVIAPRFRGLGLGKALAATGAAHAARIGRREIVGTAATPDLVPFYERLGAMAERNRPPGEWKRSDVPRVKTAGSAQGLRVDLAGMTPEDILRSNIPPYIAIESI